MSDISLQDPALAARDSVAAGPASVGDYVALLKPRVMSLVVFTGLIGILIAPGTIHPFIALTAILAIALGAGASGAINMWYDADIDAVMERTKNRPIPSGRVAAEDALIFGVVIAGGSVLIMGVLVNAVAGALLALTIGFYVFVYTMWLKRRTPQNIVIGGAAGALPPVIGWAAVTGDVAWLPVILFAIIFLWTPPHFWSLALWRSGDYGRAGVPMLPVVAGAAETRRQILLYSVVLALSGFAPALIGATGLVYGVGAGVLGALFVYGALQVWRRGEAEAAEGTHRSAKRLFAFSILYLFLLFALLPVDLWLRPVLG